MPPRKEPELSPELALVVEKVTQNMSAQLTPIKESLEVLQTDMNNMKLTTKEIQDDIENIQEDIEAERKQDLYKSVVIYGIQEAPGETYDKLATSVRVLGVELGIKSLDFDRATRMGIPHQNRTRPVAVILLRHRDKVELFAALAKRKEEGKMKNIFINQARTQEENDKYMKLLEFAKAQKRKDTATKYRIRNMILQVTSKELNGYYQVNKQGEVSAAPPPKQKAGRGTSTSKANAKSASTTEGKG